MTIKTFQNILAIGVLCLYFHAVPLSAQAPIEEIDIQSNSANIAFDIEYPFSFLVEIADSKNLYWRQNLEEVQDITITRFNQNGEVLADGLYTLQITPIFKLTEEEREALSELRKRNDKAGMAAFRAANNLPSQVEVHTIYFSILDGQFVNPNLEEAEQGDFLIENNSQDFSHPSNYANTTTRTLNYEPQTMDNSSIQSSFAQVFTQDVVVQGSICVGFDCPNAPSFGFDTQRLTEDNLRIHFDDVSNSASFPANDWRILINDSTNGGADYFGIQNSSANTVPFRVLAGAPNNALYVNANGDVGIGTASPGVELQVTDGDSPTMRLEQNGSDGFTPQTWDVVGNETNFFVRDATNNKLPFRIKPNAAANSIFIAADGDIGLETENPEQNLHIVSSTAPAIRLEHTGGTQKWDMNLVEEDSDFAITDATNTQIPLTIEKTAPTNSVVIDETGNVGFGLDAPTKSLHVNATNPALRLLNSGNSQTWDMEIPTGGTDLTFGDGTNTPVTFENGASTNSLVVDMSGNIGFGLDAPTKSLHVNATNPALRLLNSGNNQTWDIEIPAGDTKLSISDGVNAPMLIENSSPTNCFYIKSDGNVGLGLNAPAKPLHLGSMTPTFRLDLLGADGISTQAWDFSVSSTNAFTIIDATNSTTPFTVVPAAPDNSLYVDAAGNVGIGIATPGNKLHINGHLTVGGDVIVASDVRFKKDIQSMATALPIVQQLQPKQYQYRTGAFANMYLPDGKQYGFIAQEVEQILPEMVNLHSVQTSADGKKVAYKGLDYSSFVPLMVKAMQEQQDIINSQEVEIEGLKSELEEVKGQLEKIMEMLEEKK